MKIKIILLSLLAVFAPIKAAIVTVGVMIVADLITGVLAARHRKEAITSAGLRRTIAKMVIFESALLLGFLTETYLTGADVPISKLVAAFIGLVEYKSILENLNELNGSPIFSSLIEKLSKKENEEIGS